MNKLLTFIIFFSITGTQNTFTYSKYPQPENNKFDEFNEAYECHDTFKDLWSAFIKMIGMKKYIKTLRNKGYDTKSFENEQNKLIIVATHLQFDLKDCNCINKLSKLGIYHYLKTANADVANLATKNDSWYDEWVTDDAHSVLKEFKNNAEETLRRRYSNW